MNEALTHAMTRTNLENILPRERSQTPQSTRFRFCFYEVSGIGESCRARKGLSGYQGLVEGRMGNGSLMGEVFFCSFFFFFLSDEMFYNYEVVIFAQHWECTKCFRINHTLQSGSTGTFYVTWILPWFLKNMSGQAQKERVLAGYLLPSCFEHGCNAWSCNGHLATVSQKTKQMKSQRTKERQENEKIEKVWNFDYTVELTTNLKILNNKCPWSSKYFLKGGRSCLPWGAARQSLRGWTKGREGLGVCPG